MTSINSSSTTTARDAELAQLFAEQELAIQGLLADIGLDRRTAYAEGHQGWMFQEDLRLYREKLEGLAGAAKFLKGYHEFMARD
jgi:hypothetical protein